MSGVNVKFGDSESLNGDLHDELAAQTLSEGEKRIDHLLEDANVGLTPHARTTHEMLAVITDTRDALRLRLRVAQEVAATQARRVSQIPGSVFFPEYK